jgi:acyl-CoA thioesterase I
MSRFLRILFCLVLTGSALSSNTAKAQRILCFGDSITAKGEWVETVGKKTGFETINAGKSGRKAAEAKEALKTYLSMYPDLDKIILFLGVNDLPARDPRPGDVKVAACVANISDAVELALTRFKPKDIILVAPCTVNPTTMNSINREKGYHVTPPLLAKMEKDYQALAEAKGISFLSLFEVVSPENYKDGLHPNAAGDVEIAKAIIAFLAP